jgi:hypothetical protein
MQPYGLRLKFSGGENDAALAPTPTLAYGFYGAFFDENPASTPTRKIMRLLAVPVPQFCLQMYHFPPRLIMPNLQSLKG